MKKVVSVRPTRTIARGQGHAGRADSTFFIKSKIKSKIKVETTKRQRDALSPSLTLDLDLDLDLDPALPRAPACAQEVVRRVEDED